MRKFKQFCAIAVIQKNKVLLGLRADEQGWSMAGGKLEEGENYEMAAKRELQEEFGVLAITLEHLGSIMSEAYVRGKKMVVEPTVFLCKSFDGIPKPRLSEMKNLKWFDIDELCSIQLFQPTKEILDRFGDCLFK